MSAYDLDIAERNRLLQQDVIALRHALERANDTNKVLRLENEGLKFKQAQAAKRIDAVVRETLS